MCERKMIVYVKYDEKIEVRMSGGEREGMSL
jgi:hypothetical protein